MDFLATAPGQEPLLVQVSLDIRDKETKERETRALVAAAGEHPTARQLLITFDATPPPELPDSVTWITAAAWLLG